MATAPVDIPVKIKGLSDLQKLERRMQALEKEVTRLQNVTPKAKNAIVGFGRGAKGAAGAVTAFGRSIQAALGPIAPFLAAVAGIGTAFNTIKNQDFAQAKFESLGGDAGQLVTNLKAVSNELQGTASVAELTGAAYDVASAGFSSAAEASLVLKAASQGATGGFADLNTVANATTSVLNAYGLEASSAAKLVDQFVQTQNDGKIVVAEYAANIGKVASAAAGLGVPRSEGNAVIAQATASGVQAEVAFTGLKGALARLASGEATKALEGTGIEIDAASVKVDGLYGTLKKLEGLDTGQIFKALGTEAGPALLPVIQNLEKYQELLKNQEQANGVAAAAAATAAGTIEGAWKRVTVAFENLFADQSELGQVIRGTLLAAAATVEALGAAIKILIAPIRAVIEFVGELASALFGLSNTEAVLQSLTKLWFEQIAAVQNTADTIIAVGKVAGQYIGELIENLKSTFGGLWNSISSGVQSVVGAITGAFSAAFNGAKDIIMGFWDSLPGWLKGALNAAGSVVGGVTSAVSGAIGKVVDDINAAKAQVQIEVPEGKKGGGLGGLTVPTAPKISGGGGGSAGAGRKSQLPQLKQATAYAQQLLDIERQILDAQLQEDSALIRELEQKKLLIDYENEKASIMLEAIPVLEREEKLKQALIEYTGEQLDLENQFQTAERDRLKTVEEMLTQFDREIELAGSKVIWLRI